MGTTRKHALTGLLGGAALLLVLLGVLGMHAVGGHGHGHASGAAASHQASPASSTVAHALHGASEAVELLAPREPAPASWTTLCLAVLVGAVLLTLVSGRGSAALIAPRPRRGRPAPPGRRDRDPPSLVLLSVRRC